jgi:hypothetical protein
MMKSALALRWTVEALAGVKGGATFWTFTFPFRQYDEKVVAKLWANFCTALQRRFGCIGVRVFERHDSQAWHIHAVIRGRLPVKVVRSMGRRYGFGRVNVKRVKRAFLGIYLGKYLTKENRVGASKGARLWSSFGKRSLWVVAGRVRVKDVQTDSPAKRAYYILKGLRPAEIPRVLVGTCRRLWMMCRHVVHTSKEECFEWCDAHRLGGLWPVVWELTQGVA